MRGNEGVSMTLDKLGIGMDAIIESVECNEISLRKHILDMGLTPGTEVTMVKIYMTPIFIKEAMKGAPRSIIRE